MLKHAPSTNIQDLEYIYEKGKYTYFYFDVFKIKLKHIRTHCAGRASRINRYPLIPQNTRVKVHLRTYFVDRIHPKGIYYLFCVDAPFVLMMIFSYRAYKILLMHT